MKDHTEIINHYVNKLRKIKNPPVYVEIGVSIPENNFNKIKTPLKIGIDPDPSARAKHRMTSDAYFSLEPKMVDIYFLDGDHTDEQIERDIVNASKHLAKHGVILIHDTNPELEIQTLVPRQNKQFTGNVYRTVVGFIEKYPDARCYTYPQDWGITVIYPDGQVFSEGFISDIPFEEFQKNKSKLLNFV